MFEKDLYRTLARNLPGFGIFLFDHSFRYVSVIGDDILNSFSLHETDVVGKTLHEINFPACVRKLEDHFQAALAGEIRDVEVERDGRILALRLAPVRSKIGEVSAGLMTVHDVTDMVRARETLQSLSLQDELTNVYNRRGFMLLAGQQLKIADRTCSQSLIFFIDLNDLKVVNDSIGHAAGDQALKEAALVLTSAFRETDIVARYGGDEFVVFTNDVSPEMEQVFRDRLREALALFNAKNRKFRLSFSIGCSVYDPSEPRSLEELITEADHCMYGQKKERRKNGSSGSIPPVRIGHSANPPTLMMAKSK